jgi:hypothetical protein
MPMNRLLLCFVPKLSISSFFAGFVIIREYMVMLVHQGTLETANTAHFGTSASSGPGEALPRRVKENHKYVI